MKIGLFYGTTSAATQEVADLINDNLEGFEIEIFDIYKEPLEKMNDFEKTFKSKKRTKCAPPAPACGLYLKSISYW